MRSMRWGTLVLALLLCGAASAGEMVGVSLPDRMTAEGKSLVLNGMGLRKAYAVAKVYVAGLYLEKKSESPDEILGSTSVRKIVLHFVRDVSREQITGAWTEGFEKNAGAALPALRRRIDALNAVMPDLAAGDVLSFTAVPGKGVLVEVRGKTEATIEGDDFAKALLSIWLGAAPPNAALKDGLLGL